MNGFILLAFFLPIALSSPLKIVAIRPMFMAAPISQIQWNYRGDWGGRINELDMLPKSYSYQTQQMKFNDDKKSDEVEFMVDHPKPRPKSFHIMFDPSFDESLSKLQLKDITRSKTAIPKPKPKPIEDDTDLEAKSLHISLEPTLGETFSKLQLKDTFLDALQQFTTAAPKRVTTTQRPKRPTTKIPNKPKPKPNKDISTKQTEDDTVGVQQPINNEPPMTQSTSAPVPQRPNNNNLAGQSQIGNRESQMVIKPTVIVNIRGTVTNTDSDIKVESRADEGDYANENNSTAAQNVFNINQEVRIENNYSMESENSEIPMNKKPKSIIEDSGDKQSRSLTLDGNDRYVIQEDGTKTFYVFHIGPLGGFINS